MLVLKSTVLSLHSKTANTQLQNGVNTKQYKLLSTETGYIHMLEELGDDSVQSSVPTFSRQTFRQAETYRQCVVSRGAPACKHKQHDDE